MRVPLILVQWIHVGTLSEESFLWQLVPSLPLE